MEPVHSTGFHLRPAQLSNLYPAKSYQLHTPSINSENNYRTSNQLDSTQRLRRASIPLRLSSFSIEILKATTITLKTSSYENLTVVKTLCPCHRVRKKGGSAVLRVLPPTFYLTHCANSETAKNCLSRIVKRMNYLSRRRNYQEECKHCQDEREQFY